MVKNAVVKSTQNNLIPQSIDAEEALLGAILTSPTAYAKISDLIISQDFYKPANRLVYETIKFLSEKNDPVDIVTVSEKLRESGKLEDAGGRDYITDLAINSVTSVNVQYYAKLVKDTAIRRNLIAAGSEIVNMSYEADSPDLALDCAEKLIFGVSSQRNTSEMQPLTNLVFETYERIEYRYNHMNELSGVETGFYDFDNLTSGLQPSTLVILAARPAMGKTAFALNIAQHVGLRTDKAVAIFSLEMSKYELMQRMLASEAEVSSERIRTGHLQPQDWEKITTVMTAFSDNSKIFIDDTGGLSVSDIRAKCRRLAMTNKNLGLVIIDYLQLIQGNNPTNRNQEVSEISRSLKILSKELELPIMALAQLNRATESRTEKKPLLSDLRDSGSIEQDADIVMFIHRPEYYDKDNPDLKGKAQLLIAKNRSGPTPDINLLFQANITKFKNPTNTNAF
ncbi:replicative DNA helicase [bacterium]|nr:replicative DNA helicase [bacterium]